MTFRTIAAGILFIVVTTARAQTLTEIPVPAGAGSGEPFVFAAGSTLFMSWIEPVAGTKQAAVRFARFASGKWSGARTIVQRDDLFVNWADFPSMVQDTQGTLFAHWLQRNGDSTYAYDVRMATSRDGGLTWSKPFLVNRDGKKTEHGFASLMPLLKGGVGVVWLDGRNMVEGREEGEMSVRYATVDARGRIANDVALDDRTCECCATALTIGDGRPVVAYRDRSAGEIRDIATARRTPKGWSKPAVVHRDDWKIAGCPVNGPQLASRGKLVALAWFTGANGRGRVLVAFSNDGGTSFRAPVAVDEGHPIGRVDVVLLEDRSAVVTWLEQTAAGGELRARRLRENGSAEPSIKIADASTARAAGFPRIATTGGTVFIAWTDQNATAKRIRLVRWSPGPPVR